MPIITVNLLSGRTVEQKRTLAKDIAATVTKDLGLSSEDSVMIQFVDIPYENFSQGGKLALDNPPPGAKK